MAPSSKKNNFDRVGRLGIERKLSKKVQKVGKLSLFAVEESEKMTRSTPVIQTGYPCALDGLKAVCGSLLAIAKIE